MANYRITEDAKADLYQAVDDIRDGYRRRVCGADSIYYRVDGDTVEVMANLGQQDVDEWI